MKVIEWVVVLSVVFCITFNMIAVCQAIKVLRSSDVRIEKEFVSSSNDKTG